MLQGREVGGREVGLQEGEKGRRDNGRKREEGIMRGKEIERKEKKGWEREWKG